MTKIRRIVIKEVQLELNRENMFCENSKISPTWSDKITEKNILEKNEKFPL